MPVFDSYYSHSRYMGELQKWRSTPELPPYTHAKDLFEISASPVAFSLHEDSKQKSVIEEVKPVIIKDTLYAILSYAISQYSPGFFTHASRVEEIKQIYRILDDLKKEDETKDIRLSREQFEKYQDQILSIFNTQKYRGIRGNSKLHEWMLAAFDYYEEALLLPYLHERASENDKALALRNCVQRAEWRLRGEMIADDPGKPDITILNQIASTLKTVVSLPPSSPLNLLAVLQEQNTEIINRENITPEQQVSARLEKYLREELKQFEAGQWIPGEELIEMTIPVDGISKIFLVNRWSPEIFDPNKIIIALHEVFDCADMWGIYAQEMMKKGYTVIAYDQDSFGFTPERFNRNKGTKTNINLDVLRNDFIAFSDHIKTLHSAAKLNFAGHGIGAAVLACCHNYIENFGGNVELFNPAVFPVTPLALESKSYFQIGSELYKYLEPYLTFPSLFLYSFLSRREGHNPVFIREKNNPRFDSKRKTKMETFPSLLHVMSKAYEALKQIAAKKNATIQKWNIYAGLQDAAVPSEVIVEIADLADQNIHSPLEVEIFPWQAHDLPKGEMTAVILREKEREIQKRDNKIKTTAELFAFYCTQRNAVELLRAEIDKIKNVTEKQAFLKDFYLTCIKNQIASDELICQLFNYYEKNGWKNHLYILVNASLEITQMLLREIHNPQKIHNPQHVIPFISTHTRELLRKDKNNSCFTVESKNRVKAYAEECYKEADALIINKTHNDFIDNIQDKPESEVINYILSLDSSSVSHDSLLRAFQKAREAFDLLKLFEEKLNPVPIAQPVAGVLTIHEDYKISLQRAEAVYQQYIIEKSYQFLSGRNSESLFFDPQGHVAVEMTLTDDDFREIVRRLNSSILSPLGFSNKKYIEDQLKTSITHSIFCSVDVIGYSDSVNKFKEWIKAAPLPDKYSIDTQLIDEAIEVLLKHEHRNSIIPLQTEMQLFAKKYFQALKVTFPEQYDFLNSFEIDLCQLINQDVRCKFTRILQECYQENKRDNKKFLVSLNQKLDEARKIIAQRMINKLVRKLSEQELLTVVKERMDALKENFIKLPATSADELYTSSRDNLSTRILGTTHTAHDKKPCEPNDVYLALREIRHCSLVTSKGEVKGVEDADPQILFRVPSISPELTKDEDGNLWKELYYVVDVKTKLEHIVSQANKSRDGIKAPLFYNLLTSLPDKWLPGSNHQKQSARRIFQAMHLYNQEKITEHLDNQEEATENNFVFVNNIPVNRNGFSLAGPLLGYSSTTEEAKLLTEMGVLTNLNEQLAHVFSDLQRAFIQKTYKKVIEQYQEYLKQFTVEKNITFAESSEGKKASEIIKHFKWNIAAIIEREEKQRYTGKIITQVSQDVRANVTCALVRLMAENKHLDLKHGTLFQVFSIYSEQSAVAGCMSANERNQAIMGRVLALKSITLRQLRGEYLTKDENNFIEALYQFSQHISVRVMPHDAADDLMKKLDAIYCHKTQGAIAMICPTDTGGSSKYDVTHVPFLDTGINTNNRESGNLKGYLSQTKCKELQNKHAFELFQNKVADYERQEKFDNCMGANRFALFVPKIEEENSPRSLLGAPPLPSLWIGG